MIKTFLQPLGWESIVGTNDQHFHLPTRVKMANNNVVKHWRALVVCWISIPHAIIDWIASNPAGLNLFRELWIPLSCGALVCKLSEVTMNYPSVESIKIEEHGTPMGNCMMKPIIEYSPGWAEVKSISTTLDHRSGWHQHCRLGEN